MPLFNIRRVTFSGSVASRIGAVRGLGKFPNRNKLLLSEGSGTEVFDADFDLATATISNVAEIYDFANHFPESITADNLGSYIVGVSTGSQGTGYHIQRNPYREGVLDLTTTPPTFSTLRLPSGIATIGNKILYTNINNSIQDRTYSLSNNRMVWGSSRTLISSIGGTIYGLSAFRTNQVLLVRKVSTNNLIEVYDYNSSAGTLTFSKLIDTIPGTTITSIEVWDNNTILYGTSSTRTLFVATISLKTRVKQSLDISWNRRALVKSSLDISWVRDPPARVKASLDISWSRRARISGQNLSNSRPITGLPSGFAVSGACRLENTNRVLLINRSNNTLHDFVYDPITGALSDHHPVTGTFGVTNASGIVSFGGKIIVTGSSPSVVVDFTYNDTTHTVSNKRTLHNFGSTFNNQPFAILRYDNRIIVGLFRPQLWAWNYSELTGFSGRTTLTANLTGLRPYGLSRAGDKIVLADILTDRLYSFNFSSNALTERKPLTGVFGVNNPFSLAYFEPKILVGGRTAGVLRDYTLADPAPTSSQLDIAWARNARVKNSQDVSWTRNARVKNNQDIVWARKALVKSSLDISWIRRALVKSSLDLVWARRVRVKSILDIAWRYGGDVKSSLDIAWQRNARVKNSQDIVWQRRAPVKSSLDLLWVRRIPVKNSLNITWARKTRVKNSLDVAWGRLARVKSSLDLSWIRRIPVKNSLNITWTRKARIKNSQDISWARKAIVKSSLDLIWARRAPVKNSLDITWARIGRVKSSLDISWSFAGKVKASLDIAWQRNARVKNSQDISWSRQSRVKNSLNISWIRIARIKSSLDLSWNRLTRVKNSQDISWSRRALVKSSLDLVWGRLARVKSSLFISWGGTGSSAIEFPLYTEHQSTFYIINKSTTDFDITTDNNNKFSI